jgi:D-alanyl-D-alanine endopeptidase (penicillin-binding protein 7)
MKLKNLTKKILNHMTKRKTTTSQSKPSARLMLSSGVFALVALTALLGTSTYLGLRFDAPKPNAAEAAAVLLASSPVTAPPGPDAYANISIMGKAAIVYDLTNGQTLYSRNSNAALPLASITKLLTLYSASGVLLPGSLVTLSSTSLATMNDAGDSGFKVGESFTYEDLARLTLAASSNAGAESIIDAASAIKGTPVANLLASAASELHLSQTRATNGTGLDLSPTEAGAYGSARDIALLAGALLRKEPSIAHATTLPAITIMSSNGTRHSFANTDIDVTHFPSLLLSKTGYTDLAGGNLVIVYDAGINHPIAIVVLGSTQPGRFTDMRTLMSATLAHFAGIAPAQDPHPVETPVGSIRVSP